MRHRAQRPLRDRWRFSTLPTPVRSGMLVGGGLVVLGAALGVGLVDGSPDPGHGPAPMSAGSDDGRVAEPAAQHTEPAPSLTPQPRRTRTPSASGSPTAGPAVPEAPATTAAPAAAPAGGSTAPANQPSSPAGPAHGRGLAKGHGKH